MPHLTAAQWSLAIVAAMCCGMSKAGFSGLGLPAVAIFATLFGARDSTGIVLPLFIAADIGAVSIFKQHARWDYIRRTLPIAFVGVIVAALAMRRLDNTSFRPLLGGALLVLAVMQLVRVRWPDAYGRTPHSDAVALSLGFLTGMATMMANAAGPLMALYCVAVGLPKFEVVGTLAWFFFIINLFKVPFSVALGLIRGSGLLLNALLLPAVFVGLFGGRWMITRVSQRIFEGLIVALAGVAALRLLL